MLGLDGRVQPASVLDGTVAMETGRGAIRVSPQGGQALEGAGGAGGGIEARGRRKVWRDWYVLLRSSDFSRGLAEA